MQKGDAEMIEINVADVATLGVVAFVAVTGLIEISPLEINPWSMLGRLLNADIIKKVEAVKEKVDDVQKEIETVKAKTEESEAKAARVRILRFADELYQGKLHSQEHFDTILLDITAYDKYCDQHPGFKNEKTRMAEMQVRETYETCFRDRTFLR